MSTQSLTDQLSLLEKEITRLHANAVPGPWTADEYQTNPFVWLNGKPTLIASTEDSERGCANRDFIAFARTALLDLLAIAKGFERESSYNVKTIQLFKETIDELATEQAALRAENERLKSWLKKAGEDLTKESEAQATEDLERYQKDPDYH